MRLSIIGHAVVVIAVTAVTTQAANPPAPDYSKDIAPILKKYCQGCHNDGDREGKLSVESFAGLAKGGKHGPSVQAGDLKSSRLYLMITGQAKPVMPPEGEEKLKPEQIELIKAWIEAGAKGPGGSEPMRRELNVRKVAAAKVTGTPVTSIATSPDGKLIAVARFKMVELRDAVSLEVRRVITALPGKVNSVEFSVDGQWVVTSSGVPGLYGQAAIWNVADGQLVREFEGHRDIAYDAVLSPDRKVLATASYDRKIVLWNADNGQQLRVLDGHNGAVFDLAFSPDGKILGSASADSTIKLWQVATGVRLDTLSQPLKEQYTVAFSPNGEFVLAGGLDNRIRVWKLVSREKPQINPLVFARFAHEGAVLRVSFAPDGKSLASVADDQSLKLWETSQYTQIAAYEKQPENTPALAVGAGNRVFVGRANGVLKVYDRPDVFTPPSNVQPVVSHVMSANQTYKEIAEAEPNDAVNTAAKIELPAKIKGRIQASGDQKHDVDIYRFDAKAGDVWVFEVNAARAGSPLDSKLEVLDGHGQRVTRVLLQAVRDSYVTFRGIDSTTRDVRLQNWEEMDLDQYLYMNGEVCKLWLWPRGPDSGFVLYPHTGSRNLFFDTTATAHALNEPAYIVEPHPPGSKPLPNGLPVFPIYFENDDDSERELGSDSRLAFTAPTDGSYLVRLSDVRGFQGEKFSYELTARAGQPDFSAKLSGDNPTVGAGSGREFNISIDRKDGFEGEIRIDIDGVPPGFSVTTPLIIEAGQHVAYGAINAVTDAPKPTAENAKATKITATATINGVEVKHDVNNFGEIKLADAPKVRVAITPDVESPAEDVAKVFGHQNAIEITIKPGTTTTAKVRIERNKFDGRVQFEAIAHNLPHGVIVDNIGLNGLLIVEGQSERQFFLTAAPWVPEQTRIFHLKANEDGGQTSWPVILKVQR